MTRQPIYSASGALEVTKPIASEGQENYLYYSGHPIETAMKEIKSTLTIEAALEELGILTDESTEEQRQSKVAELQRIIDVSAESKTNLLTITAEGPDPNVLPGYVNAIIKVYERLEREWTRRSDDDIILFLEDRIEHFRRRLHNAEHEMLKYKRDHVLRGVGSDVASSINHKTALVKESTEIREKLVELKTVVARGGWHNDPEARAIELEIASLENRRSELRQRYTDVLPEIQTLNGRIEEKQARLRELSATAKDRFLERQSEEMARSQIRLMEIDQEIRAIDEAIDRLPEEEITEANLEMELSLARSLYQMFWQRLEQQKIKRQSKSGGVVPKNAATSAVKIYPDERMQFSISFSMALLFGFAAGVLWEVLDTSIRTIEEVEEFVKMPVIGVVPNIVNVNGTPENYEPMPGAPVPGSAGTIVHYEPRDPATEAIRSLASSLEFTFFNEGHRVLLLASATPQEGKTTTAANLSIALANAGRKTLLMDCNLRHPGVSKLFDLAGHAGLAEVLEGRLPWRTCVYPTGVENLDLIPTGELPSKPVELIKKGLADLLKECALAYDAILIDSPPILPVADGTIISAIAGGTLLIYSQGNAPRDVILRAKSKLETAKGKPIGMVLNKVRPEGQLGENYYYYHYNYYPGPMSKTRKRQTNG